HFEKMLYDNAQLVSLYSHAWQVTGNQQYRDVVYETLDFIERELSSKEGGFYSSLDADSEGEEGKYYVWTRAEIDNILGRDAEIFIDYYNVSEKGNWELGKNILFRRQNHSEIAEKYALSPETFHDILKSGKTALMEIRNKRVRPGLDDKILTSWNALMLRGYVDAYRVFGEEKFLKAALRNADFLLNNAIGDEGEITRNHKDGKSSIQGFLDDYAFSISALIGLYQATFDEKWLNRARELADYTLKYFYDENSGLFFYSHSLHADLISRNMEVPDNVIPGSNSEMARNLFALGHYFYNDAYLQKGEQMLVNVHDDMHRNFYYYSNWAILELNFISKPYEVAILGKDNRSARKMLDEYYLPDVLLSGGNEEGDLELHQNKLVPGQTTIYVCRDKVCKLPVTEISGALEQLGQ
ncbi:MAG: thioredoxin domain-containing protein, partial [Bacteroidales bacterium]|nr:thioredoxin domain-containing protein [Bacteroidales bacterium]